MPRQMTWVDENLNEEQKVCSCGATPRSQTLRLADARDLQLAVQSIVYARRRIPFLINGPPGTGKTKTVTECVLQILKAWPDAHILLCGASNPSSDTLALRLAPHLGPKQMLRLNDESRPFDEVRPTLLPWCRVKDDRFGLPDFR